MLDSDGGGGFCRSSKVVKEAPSSRSNYGALRSKLVKLTPDSMQCRLYCGGPEKCRYCVPSTPWPASAQAIPGLYSHWVTPTLLATARPTKAAILRSGLIQRFEKDGIKSVVNLQKPGEHAACSPNPLFSGFSYDPADFMAAGISHYNFGWPDFGVGSTGMLLDMVKVLEFAESEGPVAVHCHAGLGRTGVLLAAFLIWKEEISPDTAIARVRYKRPHSIQTRDQVLTLFQFADRVRGLRFVFPALPTSLHTVLTDQAALLHGLQARLFHHLPKIIYVICERLKELGGLSPEGSLAARLQSFRLGDDDFYQHLLTHTTRAAPTMALRKSSTMVSMLTTPSKESQRLPPIQLRPSFLSTTSFPAPRLGETDRSDSDDIFGREGEEVEADSVGKVGSLEWEKAVLSCLADLRVPESGDDVYGVVGMYQRTLRHRDEDWAKLAAEEDGEALLLLLQAWLRCLKIIASDDLPSLHVSTGEKWTLLYLLRTFAPLVRESASTVTLTAALLAEWISRTKNPEIANYILVHLVNLGRD